MLSTLVLLSLAAATNNATPQPANPEDRIKCVREVETGSLMHGKKVCRTVREWNAIINATRRDAESMLTAPVAASTSG